MNANSNKFYTIYYSFVLFIKHHIQSNITYQNEFVMQLVMFSQARCFRPHNLVCHLKTVWAQLWAYQCICHISYFSMSAETYQLSHFDVPPETSLRPVVSKTIATQLLRNSSTLGEWIVLEFTFRSS